MRHSWLPKFGVLCLNQLVYGRDGWMHGSTLNDLDHKVGASYYYGWSVRCAERKVLTTTRTTTNCYKAYPGLGTVAQQVAPSHLASSAGHEFESHFEHFFSKNCLRVRLIINMSPWVPRIWIEVWVGTYDRIRRVVNRSVLMKQRSRRSKGGRML